MVVEPVGESIVTVLLAVTEEVTDGVSLRLPETEAESDIEGVFVTESDSVIDCVAVLVLVDLTVVVDETVGVADALAVGEAVDEGVTLGVGVGE